MDRSTSTEMIHKSVGELHEQLDKVRSRIGRFQLATREKADALQESKQFLYFEKDIDQFISSIDDLIDAIPEEDFGDFKNVQAKMCKHQDIQVEVATCEIEMIHLEQSGLEMIRNMNGKSDIISKRIHEMKNKWQILLSRLADQIEILYAKQHYVEYLRNYEKISLWINKQTNFFTTRINFKSLESIEIYIFDFNEIERKMPKMERRVNELKLVSDFFIKDDLPQSYNVSQKKENLGYSWTVLKDIVFSKRVQLQEFIRIHDLCCRVDQFVVWMDQKYAFYSEDASGNNLEELLILLKKHESMERLLGEVRNRLYDVLQEYDSLCFISKTYTEGILVERSVVEKKWHELEAKALNRGMQLKTQSKMHKFFIDINYSIQSLKEMEAIISTEKIMEKVEDAQMSLMMLDIHRDVIFSRKDDLDDIARSGYHLLQYDHQTEEINEKLEELLKCRQSIEDLLKSQEQKFKLKLRIQLFYRDFEAAIKRLEQKEARLVLHVDQLNSLDVVQMMMQRHKEFGETFKREKKTIEELIKTEIQSIEQNSDGDQISQKQKELQARLNTIEQKFVENSKILKDSLKLELFCHDCDSIHDWLIEKLKILDNDYFMEASIISSSIVSHNLFLHEFTDYSKVIYAIVKRGGQMIKKKHHTAELIKKRVRTIVNGWNTLALETNDKTLKLEEIHQTQTFLLTTTRLELELDEFEERLSNLYVYHDGELSNVVTVETNLEDLEREVKVLQRRVDNMKICGTKLIRKKHHNSDNFDTKMRDLTSRHISLVHGIQKKKNTIKDARKAGELYTDIEEQAKWIKQKISSLSAINTDLGLVDVQYLLSKCKTNQVQFDMHEKEIVEIAERANKMIKGYHYDRHEMKTRTEELQELWNQLKVKYTQFKLKLEEAHRIYDYYAEAELNEAIMQEKSSIMKNTYYGLNEDSSAALLKIHEIIMDDLKYYGNKIEDLRKQAENCRQMPLSISAIYQRESVVSVKDFKAQEPNELSIKMGDNLILIDSSDKTWCKVEIDGRQGLVPRDCLKIIESGSSSSSPVLKRQVELQEMYDDLIDLAEIRRNNLTNTLETFTILREAAELISWIEEKKPLVNDNNVGGDMSQVEILQKRFDDFKSDQAEKKLKLNGILKRADELLPLYQGELQEELNRKTEDLKCGMEVLQKLTEKREKLLSSAHELQRFYRDVYEAEDWIQEKNEKLDNDDCGDSLKNVRTLLRKHEGVERDLDALDARINELSQNAICLIKKYPESSYRISLMENRINESFTELSKKATFRKQILLDSYDLQKFFSDHDDLMSWMNKMINIVSSEEQSNDFCSAELLMNSFERNLVEIGQYEPKIKTVLKFGEMLLTYNEKLKTDIEKKLEELRQSHELLEQKKVSRKKAVHRNLEVNAFLWDCEKVMDWMDYQEKLFSISDENDKLIKIHAKMEESMLKKQKEIEDLKAAANKLIPHCHNHEERILKKCEEVISRWQNLKLANSTKRSQLNETRTIQQFSLEAAEIEAWIDEKIQQILQETYRDPINIKTKLEKYKVFASEIELSSQRIRAVLENGYTQMKTGYSENWNNVVQRRIENISSQWNFLQLKTRETGYKLWEVSRQYDHIVSIKYINIWMGEVETILMNRDLGKSFNAIQNLLVQHTTLEGAIKIHQEEMAKLQKEVDKFKDDSIFDIVSMEDEHKLLIERFERIKLLAVRRRTRLENKRTIVEYLRTITEEEARIKEVSMRLDNKHQPKFDIDKTKPLARMYDTKYKPKRKSESTRTIEDIFREIDELKEIDFTIPPDGTEGNLLLQGNQPKNY